MYNLPHSKHRSKSTRLASAKEKGMVAKKQLTLLGVSLLILTACHLASRQPLPTSQPTVSIPSSIAPTPILPTPTVSPLTVLTNYLENVNIVEVDTFDNPSGWTPTNEISNGELLLVGLGNNNWHGLSNRASFHEGNGVVINFQFTPGESFEMYYENGPWRTSRYKRFGIYVNGDHTNANLFVGRERTDFHVLAGNLSLNPAQWYSLAMVVGEGGEFLAVVWDPANPTQSLQYRQVIADWNQLGWTFRMQVNKGTILFDNFEEIVFDSIK